MNLNDAHRTPMTEPTSYHWHSNVTGDARKRLEAEGESDKPPFDTGTECNLCGRRARHTHVTPQHPPRVMADYPGYDPT